PLEWPNFFAPLIIRMLLILCPQGNTFEDDFTPTSGAVKLAKCAKSFAFIAIIFCEPRVIS
ncbi:hypothetical protein OSK72_25730, partial [Escherichia coli]|nr:hypothetical protein [Escherichia coli]